MTPDEPSSNDDDRHVYEVSANDFIEAQTERIEREFACSRPHPRNKAMGFNGSYRPKRAYYGHKD